MTTATPPIDRHDFESALKRAKVAFDLPRNRVVYETDCPLAVTYNNEDDTHEIHTTLVIDFVQDLCLKTTLTLADACFLALAHESGHIELNQKCIDVGADPTQSNAQLAAIGIPLPKFGQIHLLAQCHKETAIEAFCDAKLAQATFKYFPSIALSIIKAVAEIRQVSSAKPKPFGDDYQTAIVLEAILTQASPMPPMAAAQKAFAYSQRNMSAMENFWLTIKRPVRETVSTKLFAWRKSKLDTNSADSTKKPSDKP